MKPKTYLFLSALALTLLSITPDIHAQTETTVVTLRGGLGKYPSGNIARDSSGNFYGTTRLGGGGYNEGQVYTITLDGKFTSLHSFESGDGDFPVGGLIQGSNGNFYGTTSRGGPTPANGTLFEITPDGTLTTLHTFGTQPSAGIFPLAGVIEGQDGNLYGTASDRGAYEEGTIYRYTPAGSFTAVHSFSAVDASGRNADGADPAASLLEDEQGDLYGVAAKGGTMGTGTVFRYSPASGAFTTLYSFSDGGNPSAALIQGGDGNFYGVSMSGGANGNGTVFRITPDGALTTMHGFSATDANGFNADGKDPQTSLFLGSDGSFYGTANQGGAYGGGTVFKLTPAGRFTTLYSFNASNTQPGETQGANPLSPLVEDDSGRFYGTLSTGVFFRLVTAAPTIYSPLSVIATVGQAFSYKINASSAPTSYNTVGLPDGLSVDTATGLITGTPTGADTFTVTIQATNASGTGSAPLTLTVRADVAPVITSDEAASGVAGQPFSYQITADNFPTSFSVLGLPKGLKADAKTGLISGSPGVAGTFHLTLKATNGAGSDTAPLTLSVTLEPPVITSPTTSNGTVANAFGYQITASGKADRFGASGLPKGLSINGGTGLISGTLQVKGTFTLTLQAFNAAGKGTQSLTLTVYYQTPVITSPRTASGTEGMAFSYQITANNAPQRFRVQRLPPGLHVDADTGVISGVPETAGTTDMTLGAVNSAGTGTQPLTLTVQSN